MTKAFIATWTAHHSELSLEMELSLSNGASVAIVDASDEEASDEDYTPNLADDEEQEEEDVECDAEYADRGLQGIQGGGLGGYAAWSDDDSEPEDDTGPVKLCSWERQRFEPEAVLEDICNGFSAAPKAGSAHERV